MSAIKKNPSAREQRYRKNQVERGYKHVRVWVPAENVDSIKKSAERLRAKFEKGKEG